MNTNVHSYLLADARKALAERHLLSALESLLGMANSLKAWNEAEQLNTLSESYRMMLSYLANGADDPERGKMYAGFMRQAYELSDVLERTGDLTSSDSYYAVSWRTLLRLKGDGFTIASLLEADRTDARTLFDALWLSPRFTTQDEITVTNYLDDETVSVCHKSLVLSALTLSGMRYFDIAKYRLLLDNVLSTVTSLRVSALVGLVFIHQKHSDRLAHYPDVEARLRLMSDVPGFLQELELLQTQLFLSLETKRIEKNLQDEIIPQMMKRINDLHVDRSLGLDELKDKLAEVDLNPEWEDDGTPSKLAAYMKEFVELQQRGADMYMGSFKMLKQRFPFFTVAANWFWPFSFDHPEMPADARKNKTLQLMLRSAGLCDSDKYSFSLIVSQLPHKLDNESMQQLMSGMPGGEDLFSTVAAADEPDFREQLRSYVQGFYRFCHLFTHREAFVNPFQHNLFLADYAPFDELLDDTEFLRRMAEFAFKDKSYALAQTLLKRIPFDLMTAELAQKLGCCYEQLGDIKEALRTYELANALKPDSAWTLRRMAVCYRASGHYEEALHAYTQLAAFEPENISIALRQAECHIQLKQYEEAFKYLFKANYLDADNHHTERAIAWCSLLSGKYEQAERYYTRVLERQEPSAADWLNAGHAAWLMGNVPAAVARYRRSLSQEKPGPFLDEDAPMLRKAGLTDNDLAMMTDAVLS